MRFQVLLFLLLGPGIAWAASKPKEGPEVLVVSDVVDSQATALRPTKENPVYYIILGGAERTLGDSIAGERMPDRARLTQEIERAMGSQGFVLTRVMLASAAPYFATETDLPKFIEDVDRRKAEVHIGTPTVVEEPAPKAPAPAKK
jgi:hypothetical protein